MIRADDEHLAVVEHLERRPLRHHEASCKWDPNQDEDNDDNLLDTRGDALLD